MSAPITTFVDVTVNLTGAVATAFGFGTPLGVFDHSITANRLDGPFTDLAAVVAAGFTSTAVEQEERTKHRRFVLMSPNDIVAELVKGRIVAPTEVAADRAGRVVREANLRCLPALPPLLLAPLLVWYKTKHAR